MTSISKGMVDAEEGAETGQMLWRSKSHFLKEDNIRSSKGRGAVV